MTESTAIVIFYELQIWGFLWVAGLVFYFISRDRKKIAAILIALAWLVVFYGSFVEPELITVTRAEIHLAHAPKTPITIALVGDHHVGPYTKDSFIRRVNKKITSLNPDIVFMAGDYVTSHDRPEDIKQLSSISDLAAAIPTYAVLGNHDEGLGETPDLTLIPEWAATMEQSLTSLGVHVLRNKTATITVRGEKILLIGLDDIPEPIGAAKKLLAHETHDKPWIALAHHPEYVVDAAPYGIDLYLTGHTHGGQIRLPFLGPLVKLPTALGQTYDHGLRYWGAVPMWITRGLGESGARARLFAPPEIVLITLK